MWRIDNNGFLSGYGIRFIESPNQDAREDKGDISLLVIHNISLPPGEYNTNEITNLFTNKLEYKEHPFYREIKDLKVSSHLCIFRDGSIIQYVSFLKRAWHAGKSIFKGRQACNDYSIGIELEGTDFDAFTDEQYTSLIKVTKLLTEKYNKINTDRITGHSNIAPDRKTDPGPFFDWIRYKSHLKKS